jgi:hypothetical protein
MKNGRAHQELSTIVNKQSDRRQRPVEKKPRVSVKRAAMANFKF